MTAAYLNTNRTAVVSPEYRFNGDMTKCPRSAKLLLLGKGGVATLAEYHGDPFWVGWFPMPRKPEPCSSSPDASSD